MAVNAIWHHPKIGYDVVDNITYIQVLWHRLPTAADTGEFFSPPLPYVLPSLYDRACTAADPGPLRPFSDFEISQDCRIQDGKFAQVLNLLASVVTTLLLLLIAEELRPGDRFFKFGVLLLLANLTVYFKTFAQVRGEPYVVLFTVLVAHLVIQILRAATIRWNLVLLTGAALGCLILSRQWGFFIYPAIAVVSVLYFFRERVRALPVAKQLMLSGLIGLLMGGFFYLHLWIDYGSFSAFNIRAPRYPSVAQLYELLRRTHLGNFDLFREPVRPAFVRAPLPILYSETWGDYWGYFTYIKPNSSFGENGYSSPDTFAGYLGRVNLLALPETILLLGGVVLAVGYVVRYVRGGDDEQEPWLWISLVTLAMLAGFAWFLYSYVLESTKVLKTTYVLQGLVLLLFPAAEFLELIRVRSRTAYFALLGILMLAFFHNAPAMITRYNVFAFW